jgi:hypothetical protein
MENLGPVEGSPILPPELLTWYFLFFVFALAAVYALLHQHIRPVHIKHRIILFLFSALVIKIFVLLGGGLLTAYWLIPRPHVVQVPENVSAFSPNEKIEIIFDRPVSRRSLEKTITPDVPGVWVFEDSIYTTHLYRRLVFYPTTSLKPNTLYNIKLSNIKNALKISQGYSYGFSLKTQPSPSILAITPQSDAANVDITSAITIELTNPNDRLSEFNFNISPEVPFHTVLTLDKKRYILKPKRLLEQGALYKLTIQKTDLSWNLESNSIIVRNPTQQIYDATFTTKQPPGIEQFSPSETNALVSSNIKICFTEAMNQESVEDNLSIEPKLEGEFNWLDSKTLEFKPRKLLYDTQYSVNLKKGTRSQGSSAYLVQDIVKKFKTIGEN